MKKWLFAVIVLFAACLLPAFGAEAATKSSDTMILDWTTEKVWVNDGELCVRGTFTNKRSDLTITKLNDFSMQITFTESGGGQYQFTGAPKKIPMVKINAGGSKTVTFNLGSFSGDWANWVTTEQYVFTYINGARW